MAVSSLARQVDIPERQQGILKGELLLNDASGIVTFQFAIAAAVTGTFSLAEATGDFCIEFFGGLLFGAVLGLLGNFLVRKVRAIGVENTTFHVLFEVCVPFLIYLVSDACGVSGVIAVVVAGLVNVISPRMVGPSISRMNIVSSNVWHVLTFALNGVVFVLLGTQLPSAMRRTWEDLSINNGVLILYILGLTFVLLAVRFIWCLAMEGVHVRRGEKRKFTKTDAKNALITTLCGAKGTITLSILFTIPVYISTGVRFPQRDLIIFLACGVIVCTLLLATFVVPLLSPKKAPKPSEVDAKANEVECSMEILRNVIEEINTQRTPENRREVQAVIKAYNDRLSRIKDANDIDDSVNVELRVQALHWEQERTLELMSSKEVSGVVGYQYLARLERLENLIRHNEGKWSPRRFFQRVGAVIRRGIRSILRDRTGQNATTQSEETRKLQMETAIYVVGKLDELISSDEVPTEDVTTLLLDYQRALAMLRTSSASITTVLKTPDHTNELKAYAYQLELEQIQQMYEEERITRTQARRMRENVHLMQLDLDSNM